MLTYRVEDMSCAHCVAAITQAIHAIDAGAEVRIDLAQHLVTVAPARANPQAVARAIAEAGYTPVAAEPSTG